MKPEVTLTELLKDKRVDAIETSIGNKPYKDTLLQKFKILNNGTMVIEQYTLTTQTIHILHPDDVKDLNVKARVSSWIYEKGEDRYQEKFYYKILF